VTDPDTVPTVPKVEPAEGERTPRGWIPWVVIGAVVVVAIAVALPLTLDSSSSTASPTPRTTAAAAATGVSGTYFTSSISDLSLLFLSLTQSGSALTGELTITAPGPRRHHLVTRSIAVSGSQEGSAVHLTLSAALDGVTSIGGTLSSKTIDFALPGGDTIVFTPGTLAKFRALVKKDRAALLG
jgi:hypothetical protein